MPSATDWYRLSANAPLSNPAYEWRTRTALLAGDWNMVRWSIEQMPAALRYLSPFRDIVERDAQSTGLDVEWAYGLIL
ncbi:MAG: Soluble lytic murein transglycosylase (EC [uncultured Paraburkholderia sp.]|nr:MAG: Soluble lytic murein transglycosylase (EC [uncultured Paraburkholderia sp.]